MTVSVGRKYHDYTAMFHYKAQDSAVEGLLEWIRADAATVTFAWSREHEDHENITDRHLQVWMRRVEPWTKQMDNDLGKNSRIGKHHLVPAKIPNEGEKNAKRWSKQDSHWSEDEGVMYVFKDALPELRGLSHAWERRRSDGGWAAVEPTGRHYKYHEILEPKRKQRRLEKKEKTETFNEKLMRLWRENGEPREERAIFKMLCEQVMAEKWNYIEGRMILRAARYIHAKTNNPEFTECMMEAYDRGDFF